MLKKILKGISNFLFIILLILLSISFYAWAQISIMHKPYSSFMGYSIFEVVTGSMSGTIEIDDYIVVKETKEVNLKDIVTFKDKEALVTHRVIEVKPYSIITKGDANNSEDIEIRYDDIIGKVVYVIPHGSVWKKVFTDIKVIILLFITMLFFTIYFSMEEKNDKENNKEIKDKIIDEEKEEMTKKITNKKDTSKKTTKKTKSKAVTKKKEKEA